MWTPVDSPVGPLRVVAYRDAVTAIEFAGPAPSRAVSPRSSVGTAAARSARPAGRRPGRRRPAAASRPAASSTAYFARDLKEFDLPLRPEGTDFQQRVWDQLQTIGYGETASYGEIARRLGMTGRGLPRGRPGQRPQPDPDRDPVPPRGRRQRHADRLRRRRRAQAGAARPRDGALF